MYYTYVYLRDNGEAYYVGKGNRNRLYMRHDVPVPKRELVQTFQFETQEEAWDTEIQLIAFYGRGCDGGTLMNLSTGGAGGTTGVIMTEERRKQRSESMLNYIKTNGHPWSGLRGATCPNSRRYRVTYPDGTTILIHGLTQFCRENNLSATALCGTSKGRRPHHKGFTAEKIE